MSETSQPESATGPIESVSVPPASEPVVVERKPSRLNQVAAWIGIAAGSVFIVGAIFFSGFFLGLVAGHGGHGGHGHHRGGQESSMHHQGPPMMFPGPMMRPGQGFEFPGGGPGGQAGQPPTSGTQTPPGR
jgi:hypothetical protein